MAIQQDPVNPANIQRIDSGGVSRTSVFPIGEAYATSGITGTMAAALASLSPVFLMRAATGAGSRVAQIDRIRLQYTTIVVYTTPLTVGRRLSVFRGTSSCPVTSGGAAIDPNPPKHLAIGASMFDSAGGGDARVATTGTLTATNVTFETAPLKIMPLSHVGNAGNFFEQVMDFQDHPLTIRAGEVLAVRAGQAFDAAGTWQLAVMVEWREITPMV